MKMLSLKSLLVNPLLLILALFSIFFSGCGFELERNHHRLIHGGARAWVGEVENQSFAAGAGIKLKQALKAQLATRGNLAAGVARASLKLRCQLVQSRFWRRTYSLNERQTYGFYVELSGFVEAVEPKSGKKLLVRQSIKATALTTNEQGELTSLEREVLAQKAIDTMALEIINLISLDF